MKYLFFGLWFSLALPSVGFFKKGGWQWGVLYMVLSMLGVWVVLRLFKAAQRSAAILLFMRAGAGVCVLVAAFLYIAYHPVIDRAGFQIGSIQIGASDTNHAIEIGVSSILQGKNPYTEKTFLGNPLSPLPGAFLLALPLHLLQRSSAQNLFWIGLFVCLFAREAARPGAASTLILLLLLGSPTIPYRIVTGGDYFSNNIYILAALLAMWRARPDSTAAWLGASVLAGIAYASRPNFLFLAPMMLLVLSHKTTWRHALRVHTVAGIIFLLLVLPFWVHDPANFSPLHLSDKVQIGGFGPLLRWLVPACGLTASLLFGLTGGGSDEFCLSRHMFWIQALMVFVVMLFASIHYRYIRWDQEPLFAVLFLFFGVYGYGVPLFRKWAALEQTE